MTELEKIDYLRARFNITYQQAKDTLDALDGKLKLAVINLEESENLSQNKLPHNI